MSQVPIWLEIVYRVSAILGVLGGALAFLLVIWPSIRRQNRFLDRAEQKSVEKILEDL